MIKLMPQIKYKSKSKFKCEKQIHRESFLRCLWEIKDAGLWLQSFQPWQGFLQLAPGVFPPWQHDSILHKEVKPEKKSPVAMTTLCHSPVAWHHPYQLKKKIKEKGGYHKVCLQIKGWLNKWMLLFQRTTWELTLGLSCTHTKPSTSAVF